MRKRLRIIALAAALLASLVFLPPSAAASTQGACGEHAFWTVENGVLAISGSGETDSWRDPESVPWYSLRSAVRSVVVGEGITSLGDRAFAGCAEMESVSLPGSLEHIGAKAFQSCKGLASVEIPASVVSMGANPFAGCDRLERLEVAPGSAAFRVTDGVLYSADGERLVCYPCAYDEPAFTVPEGVRAIADSAFLWSSLESVTLPGSVETIEESAFQACYDLLSADLGGSVREIGPRAFSFCISLPEIALPASLETIGDEAFAESYELASVNIPDAVVRIGDRAFQSTAVAEIVLPASLQSVGANPFYACGQLASVRTAPGSAAVAVEEGALYSLADRRLVCLPLSLSARDFTVSPGTRIIGEDAFAGAGLTGIVLPDSVARIESGAFAGCGGLPEIRLPAPLAYIGDRAFSFCDALVSVSLPDAVERIGAEAFTGCYHLREVKLPASLVSVGDGAFANCNALEGIAFPPETATIGARAFYQCTGLTAVSLPASLTFIGDEAFRACLRLSFLALPDSLEYIGADAFRDCAPSLVCSGSCGGYACLYCVENGIPFVTVD